VSPDDFRRLALALPDTVEGAHHDHPDFRAHGRVFASLHPDGEQAMVKVPLPVQARLVQGGGGVWVPANGAWGRAGCTMARLAKVGAGVVREALLEAWQLAAAAPRSVKAAKPVKPVRRTKNVAKSSQASTGKPTGKPVRRRGPRGAR
jgi:hypothetical protein